MAALWESALTAAITVGAIALTAVAVRSYRTARTKRVLMLALGFTSFAVKGLFLSWLLFADPAWERPGLVASLAFDALALAFFAAAVLGPSPSSRSSA